MDASESKQVRKHWAARLNEQGQLNFQELVKDNGNPKPAGVRGKAVGEAPWRVHFKAVGLNDLSVKYSDRSRLYPFEIGVTKLGVNLRGSLSYAPDKIQALVEGLGVTFSSVAWKEIGKEEPLATLETLAVEGGPPGP